jgi:hypothetical protein
VNKKQLLGSNTAKGGFRNELDIVDKFNDWQQDIDAKKWLQIMGYDLDKISKINAVVVRYGKTDVQVHINIILVDALDVQNIQVKLVSQAKGYNQIDKRWVDDYAEYWNMPKKAMNILKRYCGEIAPDVEKPRDKRRMFFDEFTKEEQSFIIKWLNEYKTLIVCDILKGRGQFAAEWMLVAQKFDKNANWKLLPMNICINHYGNGKVSTTPRGNIKIGTITVQRKGGDGGRPTACMLQFKMDPAEIFSIQ